MIPTTRGTHWCKQLCYSMYGCRGMHHFIYQFSAVEGLVNIVISSNHISAVVGATTESIDLFVLSPKEFNY